MVAEETAAGLEIRWCDDALGLRVAVDERGRGPPGAPRADGHATRLEPVRARRSPVSGEPGAIGLPLLDVVVAGSGRRWSGRRYCESVVGNRMRYVGHTEREGAQWFELEVSLEDTCTGLQATVTYQVLLGGGALRSRVRMTNGGASPLTLESVTSFLGGDLAGPGGVARRRRAALGGKRLVGRRHAGRPGASATPCPTSTGPCTVPAREAGSP